MHVHACQSRYVYVEKTVAYRRSCMLNEGLRNVDVRLEGNFGVELDTTRET